MSRKLIYLLRWALFCCWTVVLGFVFAESFLQLAGAVVRMQAKRLHARPMREIPDGCVKILCVGDSNTFGMGAPRDMSYPAQLERMLNSDEDFCARKKQFAVINAGVPGSTTRRALEKLPELMDIYNPAAVFVFAGVNNHNWDCDCWFSSSRAWPLRALAGTRLWRLFVMAKIRVKTLLYADSLNQQGIKDNPLLPGDDLAELFDYADRYIADKRYDDAFSCLMAALYHSYDSTADFTYTRYNFFCVPGTFDPMVTLLPGCWDIFIDVCRRMSQIPDAVERLEQSGADSRIAMLVQRFLTNRVNIEDRINDWVASDMRDIVNICRTNGALPIIIGYFSEDKLDSTLSTVAKQTGAAFINNVAVFGKLGSRRPDYFAPDRHPNEKGYKLIAQQSFDIIKHSL